MHNTSKIAFAASGFKKSDAYASFGIASSLNRQESLVPRGASLTFSYFPLLVLHFTEMEINDVMHLRNVLL